MSSTRFSVDYSKRVSKCKKCKTELEKGVIRLAKIVPNPFGDDGDMKQYYHIKCLFDTFLRVRANTKIIESADDIEDFETIEKKDKKNINEFIENLEKSKGDKKNKKAPSSKKESNDTDTDVDIEEESSKKKK